MSVGAADLSMTVSTVAIVVSTATLAQAHILRWVVVLLHVFHCIRVKTDRRML